MFQVHSYIYVYEEKLSFFSIRFGIRRTLDCIFPQHCTDSCIVFYIPHYFTIHNVHNCDPYIVCLRCLQKDITKT